MKRMILLVLTSVWLWCAPAWAACTGSSPTWTTDGNERADVVECVTAASTGDTINVIAGDGAATWTSPVPLTSTKDQSVIGPNIMTCSNTPGSPTYSCSSDNTLVVTCNSGCFTVQQEASQRVSGFTMTSNNLASIGWDNSGQQNYAKHFRIDHNRMVMSPANWEFLRPTGG